MTQETPRKTASAEANKAELTVKGYFLQRFCASLDLDQVLKVVEETATKALKITNYSIWVIDPKTEDLVCLEAKGAYSDSLLNLRILKTDPLAGWSLPHRDQTQAVPQALIFKTDCLAVSDGYYLLESVFGDKLTVKRAYHKLSVPMKYDQEIIGVMLILTINTSPFTGIKGRILELFADSAAFAIRNAQKHEQDIKELHSELRTLQAKIQKLTDFVSTIAHDLRSPLSSVVNRLEILEERLSELTTPDEIMQILSESLSTTDRIRLLLNNLLALALSEAEISFTDVNCNQILKDLVIDLGAIITERKVKVEFSNLPTIQADPTLMRLLLQNLIENAIKYCDKDQPEVTILAVEKDKYWQFFVIDNGNGIPREDWEKIFEPFTRGAGAEIYPGSGLGLANCRNIVERHGGTIWVDSEVGKGTTFFFTIPKRPPTA